MQRDHQSQEHNLISIYVIEIEQVKTYINMVLWPQKYPCCIRQHQKKLTPGPQKFMRIDVVGLTKTWKTCPE